MRSHLAKCTIIDPNCAFSTVSGSRLYLTSFHTLDNQYCVLVCKFEPLDSCGKVQNHRLASHPSQKKQTIVTLVGIQSKAGSKIMFECFSCLVLVSVYELLLPFCASHIRICSTAIIFVNVNAHTASQQHIYHSVYFCH